MKIDGKEIAAELFRKQKTLVAELKKKNITPHLVVILVGDDPASHAYVRQKKLRGEGIGMLVTVLAFKSDITETELLEKINDLNNDPSVHGIVIQQPLPKHINPRVLVEKTDPKKDVDGFHSLSVFTPPIAEAVIEILKTIARIKHEVDFTAWLQKQTVSVIGKGETGGKPIAEKLKNLGVTPQIIDSRTKNKQELLHESGIIISCVGKKDIICAEDISAGTILLSIGMYRGEDGKLHGDYETENIENKAEFYTPVPGGVGPVNVAKLLENVILASKI